MKNVLIKLPEVIRQTTLKKSTIYDQIRDGIFPPQKPLGKKRVAWLQSDIQSEIKYLKAESSGAVFI